MSAAPFFSPPDMAIAANVFGAACGHGALAAVFGKRVVDVLHLFTLDPKDRDRVQSWVNMPIMDTALRLAKVRYRIIGRDWPTDGLAMIQWTGPWTKPGVPARVACMHRHWVAVRVDPAIGVTMVWDANLEDWVTRADWERFANELKPAQADGWTVPRGYEITR